MRIPTDGEPLSAPPLEGNAGRARPRAAPRRLSALRGLPLGEDFGRAVPAHHRFLRAGRRHAAPYWRQLVRLYARHHRRGADPVRSEERRVGTACVSTCRSRLSLYHSKTKTKLKSQKNKIIQ